MFVIGMTGNDKHGQLSTGVIWNKKGNELGQSQPGVHLTFTAFSKISLQLLINCRYVWNIWSDCLYCLALHMVVTAKIFKLMLPLSK